MEINLQVFYDPYHMKQISIGSILSISPHQIREVVDRSIYNIFFIDEKENVCNSYVFFLLFFLL